jgi:hypothetical protein
VEHLQGDDRRLIVRRHTAAARGECIVIHPSDTVYNSLFNRCPLAIRKYGFQRSFSLAEMDRYLASTEGIRSWSHIQFHSFYTVPLLHNWEVLNRVVDRALGSGTRGGLTLTHVLIQTVP